MDKISSLILKQSHDACIAYGIKPTDALIVKVFVDEAKLEIIRKAKSSVIEAATVALQKFTKAIAPSSFLSCVLDETGIILEVHTSDQMKSLAEFTKIKPGGVYQERFVGTNAISLALQYDMPTTLVANEHFHEALYDWACYAAPIHDKKGDIIAVVSCLLSKTIDSNILQNLFLGFAELIEGRLELIEEIGRLQLSNVVSLKEKAGR